MFKSIVGLGNSGCNGIADDGCIIIGEKPVVEGVVGKGDAGIVISGIAVSGTFTESFLSVCADTLRLINASTADIMDL